MRFLLLATAALAVLAATPFASAELWIDGGRDATVDLRAVASGFEGAARFPFQVPGDGLVYAKLLPMPGNAVNDGNAPNGTLAASGQGVSGWWTTLSFWPSTGTAVSGSGPVARVDGTPTDTVKAAGGANVALQVLVHAPADAFLHAPTYTVNVVLAFRPAQDASQGSGGVMDDAVALTTTLRQSMAAVMPSFDAQPESDPTSAPVAPGLDDEGRRSTLSPLIIGASLGAVAIIGGALVLNAFRGRPGRAVRGR